MRRLTSCGALSALESADRTTWGAGGLVRRKTGLGTVWDTCANPLYPVAVTRFALVHPAGGRTEEEHRRISRFASWSTGWRESR